MHLEKTKISVSDFFDNAEEKDYWLSRTPEERSIHIEKLLRICYGKKAEKRMNKIALEIVQVD